MSVIPETSDIATETEIVVELSMSQEETLKEVSFPETSEEESVTESESVTMIEETSRERETYKYSYEGKVITEEGKSAIKTLISDYLTSEQVENNPVIWSDFDRLYELTDSDTANVWVDIVTEWDSAIKGEFVNGDWTEIKPCFVVLGYRLNADGSMDNELITRLDKVTEIANAYDGYILCSGGNTTNTRAEADAMKEYLIGKGIDKDRIIAENKSRTTIENVVCSQKLFEDYGIENIVIITSRYHLTGATELFQEAFMLSGNRMSVVGAVGCDSAKNDFSNETLASWMYDLFLRKNRGE